MPIEIRLQILASSKDVIHSWAIPSAGIKIDCVPGYSSHRVMIFLVSGIFWGQCMEICGRYHHWMPIVIYFMKRDLFFVLKYQIYQSKVTITTESDFNKALQIIFQNHFRCNSNFNFCSIQSMDKYQWLWQRYWKSP